MAGVDKKIPQQFWAVAVYSRDCQRDISIRCCEPIEWVSACAGGGGTTYMRVKHVVLLHNHFCSFFFHYRFGFGIFSVVFFFSSLLLLLTLLLFTAMSLQRRFTFICGGGHLHFSLWSNRLKWYQYRGPYIDGSISDSIHTTYENVGLWRVAPTRAALRNFRVKTYQMHLKAVVQTRQNA